MFSLSQKPTPKNDPKPLETLEYDGPIKQGLIYVAALYGATISIDDRGAVSILLPRPDDKVKLIYSMPTTSR